MVPGRTGPKDSECPGTNKSRELASQKSRDFFCRSEDFLDSFFFAKSQKNLGYCFIFQVTKMCLLTWLGKQIASCKLLGFMCINTCLLCMIRLN